MTENLLEDVHAAQLRELRRHVAHLRRIACAHPVGSRR